MRITIQLRNATQAASLAVLLSLCTAAALADGMPPVPIDRWLSEPDRQEIRWKVQVRPARLTYAERQMVLLRGEVDVPQLQRASVHRDLHLLVRAGDGAGHWFEDVDYTHYEVTASLGNDQNLEFTTAAYVRPGRYQMALVLYDAVLGQHNVTRRWVDVPALKDDPLPRMEEFMPAVSFVSPGQVPMLTGPRLSLPLRTVRPVNVDVIVNFSPSTLNNGRMGAYRNNEGVFLELTHVLSQLQLYNGCVWVTGLDVGGLRVLFEREEAHNLNWDSVRKVVAEVNGATIDVNTLENRKQAADFLRHLLERLFVHPPPVCPAASRNAPALPVYILAGSGMVFPYGTHVEPVRLGQGGDPASESGCGCLFYHLRGVLRYGDFWDEIAKIVKPVKPRRFVMEKPMDFRKALAEIMRDVEASATGPPAAAR